MDDSSSNLNESRSSSTSSRRSRKIVGYGVQGEDDENNFAFNESRSAKRKSGQGTLMPATLDHNSNVVPHKKYLPTALRGSRELNSTAVGGEEY